MWILLANHSSTSVSPDYVSRLLIIGFGYRESSDEVRSGNGNYGEIHTVVALGFRQDAVFTSCSRIVSTRIKEIKTIDGATTSSSSDEEIVGAGGTSPKSSSSDEEIASTGGSTPKSSSDEEIVGAGGSSSKKGKQKKGSSKKATGQVIRLTSTDPQWPKDIPDTYESCEKDWRKDGILREVIDQGEYEVCWAVVLRESIEAALNIIAKREQRNRHPSLSAQHLINNVRKLTSGAMGRFNGVRKFLVEQGLVTENLCEYTGSILQNGCDHAIPEEAVTRINDLVRIKKDNINEKDLITLVNERPVMVQIRAVQSFLKFKGDGIYRGPSRKEDPEKATLHALLLVGFGTVDGVHYWIVKNSYGTDWGQGGYGKIIRQCSRGNNDPSLFEKIRYPQV